MYGDSMELRGVAEAVPVSLLYLSRLVGVEEEVAVRGSAGERPNHAGFDDTSSGHSTGKSQNHARRRAPALRAYATMRWRFAAIHRRPPEQENTQESVRAR